MKHIGARLAAAGAIAFSLATGGAPRGAEFSTGHAGAPPAG